MAVATWLRGHATRRLRDDMIAGVTVSALAIEALGHAGMAQARTFQ